MKFADLRALLAALEHGSLLAAAEALGLARSTLRARLDALEQEVGVELLVRTATGVLPTPAGEVFAERARALLAEADTLARFGQAEPEEGLVGELRVRAPTGMPPDIAAMFLAEMLRRHPGVRLITDLRVDPLRELSGDEDLIVHFGPAPPRGAFRTCAVLRYPERLVASPAYLAARGTPAHPGELGEHTLLSWTPPGEEGRDWPLRAGGWLRVSPALVSPDIHIVRLLAIAGVGIARVPDPELVRGLLPGEALVPVLEGQVGREGALRVLLPEARAHSPRCRMALKLVRDMAGGDLPTVEPQASVAEGVTQD